MAQTIEQKRSSISLYLLLVLFRILNSFVVQTFGHPDEYWQSLEVAHRQVFNYGYLTWEWSSASPIRSPIFPGFFSLFYFLLKKCGYDSSWLVAYGPRIIHSFIGGLFDLFFVKVAIQITKIKDTWFWVLLNYTFWYSLYIVPRTLINVSEAMLFIAAFYFWTLAFKKNNLKYEVLSRLLISVNFWMRPTSIVIWAPIWLIQGFSKFQFRRFLLFCGKCFVNCVFMIAVAIGIDTLYFGKLTWTAFNFLKFNVLEDKAAQYGIYDPSWYFTAAIPLITLGWFPIFVIGVVDYTARSLKKKRIPELVLYIAFESLFLSLNPHKEDRFLMKLLPFIFILTGMGIRRLFILLKSRRLFSIFLFIIITINLFYAVYANLIDKRGSIDMIDHLRKNSDEVHEVLLFTECHRTPFLASIHKNIPVKFPECSPYEVNKINDSKLLFVKPAYFIERWLQNSNTSHLVVYSEFLEDPNVLEVLKEENFKEETRYFNSLFVDTPHKYYFWHELVLFKRD